MLSVSLFCGVMMAFVFSGAAHAASLTLKASSFTGDPMEVSLSLDDSAAGAGEIYVEVSISAGYVGDLRGLFLNLSDPSLLAGLMVTGPDLSSFDFGGSVTRVGGGNNVNGGGGPCPCDLGLEFGSPGIGKDDLQNTWFVLSHESQALSLALFEDQWVGVRVTSVGEDRSGSSKLTGVFVPEPSILALLMAAASSLGWRRFAGVASAH